MQFIRPFFLPLVLAVGFTACGLVVSHPAHAQVNVAVSVDVEPPPLPVYEQPEIPGSGYLWVPGYWAWSDDVGYYWVPGTWVLPPEPGLLWTPGYWGWNDGLYGFYPGYWGPHIGFYGGVYYGFGYTGSGYEGGYWRGGAFFYNRTVNNFGGVAITSVYNKAVIVNNTTNVSFNGGAGGITARPTPQELAVANERHIAATSEQTRNAEAAAKDPALSLSQNHGHPTVAATPHPAEFKGPGVIAAHPGKPIEARRPLRTPTGGSTTLSPSSKGSNEPARLKSNAPVTNEQKPSSTPNALEERRGVNPPPPGPKPLEERRNVNPSPPAGAVRTAKPVAAPPPPPPRRPPPPPPKPKCPPGQKC